MNTFQTASDQTISGQTASSQTAAGTVRVLFVDDDVSLLGALRRTLHDMRGEWDMDFAEGGVEALELLDAKGADVLVTDMRMPGMDGAELLAEVCKRHPGVIRIVLSGYAKGEAVARAIACSHQYLDKPCDLDRLIGAIRRSLKLRDMLRDERLRTFVTGCNRLPSRPSIYQRFVDEVDSPAATAASIAAVVEADVALSAKVLKLVNSAYFAVPTRVNDCRHAVQLLGIDTLRGVVALSAFLAEFENDPNLADQVERLGRRSVEIGALAREIMAVEGGSHDECSHACTGGLLAHVGTLLLIANHTNTFLSASRICDDDGVAIVDAERMVLGASHAELGAYLLGLWNFPDPVIEAVACHHAPAAHGISEFCPAIAVHAAQAVVRAACCTADDGIPIHTALDLGHLRALGKADRVTHWRRMFEDHNHDGDRP